MKEILPTSRRVSNGGGRTACYRRQDAEDQRLRARSEITESPVATHWFLDVMAGAGPPSTTCNAGIKKDVDDRLAPAMTTYMALPTLKRLFVCGPLASSRG